MSNNVPVSFVVVLFLLSAALLAGTTSIKSNGIARTDDLRHDHRRRLTTDQTKNNEEFLQETRDTHIPLFELSDITVIGPSSFPKPNALAAKGSPSSTDEIVNYLSPAFGTHRPNEDAVFLFAAEYALPIYVLFLSTLRETGYTGDVVIAISKLDYNDRYIKDYLESDPHIIIYVSEFTCFNAEMETVASMKGGIRVCKCHNLYGRRKQGEEAVTPLEDPRQARTVPTTRYELYWIWILHYSKHSWIMMIDARDTVFQKNPFDFVPREPDETRKDGLLILFGENMEATRIGKSKKNRKWLTHAYGAAVAAALRDKPTICSGSTMGEQVAVESYLRAMVSESDETGTKLMGADQGFHNYLYYSNKLAHAETIHSILVQDQGSAIINNLGALRTKELGKWGNGKLIEESQKNGRDNIRVLNWNGEPSPVVHQFDRHQLLSLYWYKAKTLEYRAKWENEQKARLV